MSELGSAGALRNSQFLSNLFVAIAIDHTHIENHPVTFCQVTHGFQNNLCGEFINQIAIKLVTQLISS